MKDLLFQLGRCCQCSHEGLLFLLLQKGPADRRRKRIQRVLEGGFVSIVFCKVLWFFIGWDLIKGLGRAGHVMPVT